jgi:Domain of unknown function (DUF4874)
MKSINQEGIMNFKPIRLTTLWLLGFALTVLLNSCNNTQPNSSVELTPQAIVSVATGVDDADVGLSQNYWCSGDNSLYLSSTYQGQSTALRFAGLTIPRNATITLAKLTFTAANNPTSIPTGSGYRVKGMFDASSWSPNTACVNQAAAAQNFIARIRTNTSKTDQPITWVKDTTKRVVDVQSIVQEIVNDTRWSSGAMAFAIDALTTSTELNAYSYEGGSTTTSKRPTLEITYTTGTGNVITYQSDTSNFANPERGLFLTTPRYSSDTPTANVIGSTFLNSTLAQSLKNKSMTIIRRIYVLNTFRNSAISNVFLTDIENDFLWARSNGIKLNLRFDYTHNEPGAPAPDPT